MSKIPTFPPVYQVCERLYRLEPMAENALFLSQIVKKNIGIRRNIMHYHIQAKSQTKKLRKTIMIKSILKRHASTLALAVAVSFTAALSAHAQLVYEGFAYTAGEGLTNSSMGGAGNSYGWTGPWGGANNSFSTNQAGSLTYVDYFGNSLITDGGKVVIGNLGGMTASAQITRSMALGTETVPTKYSGMGVTGSATTYWASYIMQWIGPPTTFSTTNQYARKGDLVFRSGSITNAPGGGTAVVTVGSPNARNRLGTPYDTWSTWSGNDAGNDVQNTGLAWTSESGNLTNTTFVLMRFDLEGTVANDTVYTWFNWTNLLAMPDISTASTTNTTANEDGINNIRLDANGGNTGGTNTVLAFDEFRLGTTFGDVAVVPEPAIFGLMAIGGGLTLLALRRRRQ